MYRWLILVLSILLLTTNAFAEKWVCQKGNSLIKKEGDGVRLGVCDVNNTNIAPQCILATEEEYNLASQQYKKLDKSIVTGSRIIDMTQAEIDALVLSEQSAQAQADTIATEDLSVTLKEAFTAFIKVYNSKHKAVERITKQELIEQLKADKGL